MQSYLSSNKNDIEVPKALTLDVFNWHEPLLCLSREELDRKTNENDHVVVAVPLYKITKVTVHNANGDKVNDEKGKTKHEEKTVLAFLICTIKQLHLLKVNFTKNLGLHLQIDCIYCLTSAGWVLMIIVLHCNRFDATKHEHIRSLLQGLFLVAFTECHEGCVFLVDDFRDLGIARFGLSHRIRFLTAC